MVKDHTVDSRYLEHRAISNKTLGPNSSGVTTRYLELPAILNFLPGPLRVRDSGSWLYMYTQTFFVFSLRKNCKSQVITTDSKILANAVLANLETPREDTFQKMPSGAFNWIYTYKTVLTFNPEKNPAQCFILKSIRQTHRMCVTLSLIKWEMAG